MNRCPTCGIFSGKRGQGRTFNHREKNPVEYVYHQDKSKPHGKIILEETDATVTNRFKRFRAI